MRLKTYTNENSFLIIITASFSFAVYSLFNNIGKAKNELRNPATAYKIAEQQTEAAQQSTNAAKIKNKTADVTATIQMTFQMHRRFHSANTNRAACLNLLFDGSYTAQTSIHLPKENAALNLLNYRAVLFNRCFFVCKRQKKRRKRTKSGLLASIYCINYYE